MRYFPKIKGERVYLSPINLDDAPQYTKWINDHEVSGYLGNFPRVISLENERKFLERLASEGQNYAIVLREGDVLLGNISLDNINAINRTATVGLFIGEAQYRSQGYGAEALRLILGFGFYSLNLHNIMLEVFADNPRAIRCYEKVGFREIGRRKEAVYKDGAYVDQVMMEMLEDEYKDKYGPLPAIY